jgi:hypothetical protein
MTTRLTAHRHRATAESQGRRREFVRIRIFPAMSKQIAARQPLPISAVNRVPVPVTPLVRVEQKAPSDLVLEEVDMAELHDEPSVRFTGKCASASRRSGKGRGRHCAVTLYAHPWRRRGRFEQLEHNVV